jgi:hypothetical protein
VQSLNKAKQATMTGLTSTIPYKQHQVELITTGGYGTMREEETKSGGGGEGGCTGTTWLSEEEFTQNNLQHIFLHYFHKDTYT